MHPHKLQPVVFRRGGKGVRGAAHLERRDANGAVELVKPAGIVRGRSLGGQGAVFVHPHKLHAVVFRRGDKGVRVVAHPERSNACRAVEHVEPAGIVRGRSLRL